MGNRGSRATYHGQAAATQQHAGKSGGKSSGSGSSSDDDARAGRDVIPLELVRFIDTAPGAQWLADVLLGACHPELLRWQLCVRPMRSVASSSPRTQL
jgi:hypothetical protein